MQLTSVQSAYSAPDIEGVARARTPRSAVQQVEGSGDTVSFSEEARALAAAMSAGKTGPEQTDSAFAQRPRAGSTNPDVLEGGSDKQAVATPGSGEDIAARQTKIMAQIQKIQQEIQAIMAGPGTPQEKMTKSQPLVEKMHQLMQEALALEQQARQQAMASMNGA